MSKQYIIRKANKPNAVRFWVRNDVLVFYIICSLFISVESPSVFLLEKPHSVSDLMVAPSDCRKINVTHVNNLTL